MADFTKLKIDVKNFKLLIVKSGYLSPELQELLAPSFMVLSDGAVNQDLKSIENINRNKKVINQCHCLYTSHNLKTRF